MGTKQINDINYSFDINDPRSIIILNFIEGSCTSSFDMINKRDGCCIMVSSFRNTNFYDKKVIDSLSVIYRFNLDKVITILDGCCPTGLEKLRNLVIINSNVIGPFCLYQKY